MMARFWEVGRQPSRNEAFTIAVRNGSSTSIVSFSMKVMMGSSVHDLVGEDIIVRRTSSSEQTSNSVSDELAVWRRRRTIHRAITDDLHLVAKESTEVFCSVLRRRWCTLVVFAPQQLRQRLPQLTAVGMLLLYPLRPVIIVLNDCELVVLVTGGCEESRPISVTFGSPVTPFRFATFATHGSTFNVEPWRLWTDATGHFLISPESKIR